MITIKVEYTVKAEFAERNRQNIEKVMADLKSLNDSGIRYAAYTQNDERSFVHFAQYRDEAARDLVTSRDAFKHFQTELKASGPERAPVATNLNLVAAAFEIF